MSLWTPLNTHLHPMQWFDAQDDQTIVYSASPPTISTWNSKGYTGAAVTETSIPPQVSTAGFGGRPAVLNSETTHFSTSFNVPAAFRFYSVQSLTGTQNSILGGTSTFVPLSESGSSTNQVLRVNGVNVLGPQTFYINGSPVTVNTRGDVHNALVNSSNILCIRNIPAYTAFKLFSTDNVAFRPSGRIGEILCIPESAFASQADDDLIVGYLAWKWGLEGSLPANHPYKTAAPQKQPGAANSSSMSYGSGAASSSDLGTYTFSGLNFGSPNAERYVAAVITYRAAGTTINTNSVTIGGVNAILSRRTRNTIDGNSTEIAVYIAKVPTGSTGSVVVTLSSSAVRAACAVFSLYNIDTANFTSQIFTSPTDMTSASVSYSLSLTKAAHVIAATFYSRDTGSRFSASSATIPVGSYSVSMDSQGSWTTLTNNYETLIEGTQAYQVASVLIAFERVDAAQNIGAGTLSLSGSATGSVGIKGSAAGVFNITMASSGKIGITGGAAGVLGVTVSARGSIGILGQASGFLSLGGLSIGEGPEYPTEFTVQDSRPAFSIDYSDFNFSIGSVSIFN